MDNEESAIPHPEPQADPLPPAPDETDDPAYTHRGTGFIARLPVTIRDQIGTMILDGVPDQQILDTIGEPVKHLTTRHIISWRKFGFKLWEADYRRAEALQTTRQSALRVLEQKAGTTVQDAGRTVASAQLYELLTSFDPTAFANLLAEKPELYLRIITTLVRLGEGEAARSHHRALQSAIEAKLPLAQGDSDKKLVSAEILKDIARQVKLL